MNSMYTIPTAEQMRVVAEMTPEYMIPNTTPSAVVFEGLLSRSDCERILTECAVVETYGFHGCNAHTRECVRPLSDCLSPILDALTFANDYFFEFDIFPGDPAAWLQSYKAGQDYNTHTDGSPGQSRKLTAVAMLTDPRDYAGGSLVFNIAQKEVAAPSVQGTVIVFPAWVSHRVTSIDHGHRQTINLGVWGPPFK
jgi:hypothetical protein